MGPAAGILANGIRAGHLSYPAAWPFDQGKKSQAFLRMKCRSYILSWSFTAAPVRFRFVFPTGAILKDFPGSFFGSFRFVFGARSFVFSNFSGSFFKNNIFFLFFSLEEAKIDLFLSHVFSSAEPELCGISCQDRSPLSSRRNRPARHFKASTVA